MYVVERQLYNQYQNVSMSFFNMTFFGISSLIRHVKIVEKGRHVPPFFCRKLAKTLMLGPFSRLFFILELTYQFQILWIFFFSSYNFKITFTWYIIVSLLYNSLFSFLVYNMVRFIVAVILISIKFDLYTVIVC